MKIYIWATRFYPIVRTLCKAMQLDFLTDKFSFPTNIPPYRVPLSWLCCTIKACNIFDVFGSIHQRDDSRIQRWHCYPTQPSWRVQGWNRQTCRMVSNKSHLNSYGLHLNKNGTSIFAKNIKHFLITKYSKDIWLENNEGNGSLQTSFISKTASCDYSRPLQQCSGTGTHYWRE